MDDKNLFDMPELRDSKAVEKLEHLIGLWNLDNPPDSMFNPVYEGIDSYIRSKSLKNKVTVRNWLYSSKESRVFVAISKKNRPRTHHEILVYDVNNPETGNNVFMGHMLSQQPSVEENKIYEFLPCQLNSIQRAGSGGTVILGGLGLMMGLVGSPIGVCLVSNLYNSIVPEAPIQVSDDSFSFYWTMATAIDGVVGVSLGILHDSSKERAEMAKIRAENSAALLAYHEKKPDIMTLSKEGLDPIVKRLGLDIYLPA